MDKRRSRRTIVNIRADLIIGDKRLASFIENLSSDGLYVTAPAHSSFNFVPDTQVEMRFEFPEGEKIKLHCLVKWSYRTPPFGLTHSVGMTIIDPPLTYIETLKSLE